MLISSSLQVRFLGKLIPAEWQGYSLRLGKEAAWRRRGTV
jgi:hypothetical protein